MQAMAELVISETTNDADREAGFAIRREVFPSAVTSAQCWLRFSLRTLLIVVTLLAVPLGWVGWRLGQVRRERATITWVEETGGEVAFQYGTDRRSWWEESTGKWFGETVREVSLE